MKIIHCADLHLDSKMETHFTPMKAKERKNEILMTFARLVEYAKDNQVEIIIIAGDMFDTGKVTQKTKKYVLDLIKEANQIDFLYLPGNHDEDAFIKEIIDIPHNLKIFTNQWTYYRYQNIVIAGMTSTNQMIPYQLFTLPKETKNIVVLHGQETTGLGVNGDISLSSLQNKNIDYLALGHIHSYKAASLDKRGVYCYCGCLEARGFDECGSKGFVLLEVETNDIKHSFIPFAKRTCHEIKVDISKCQTTYEIEVAIRQVTGHIEETDLVKIVLTGYYTVQTEKDMLYLRQWLEDKYYVTKLVDESKLMIQMQDYQYDISLKGEFVRLVMASALSKAEQDAILMLGIRALSGEDFDE